jgi:hypothetical protein
VNHVNFSAAANPVGELVDSKHYLEDVLGEEITAFGNLLGKFDSHVAWLVQTAGYRPEPPWPSTRNGALTLITQTLRANAYGYAAIRIFISRRTACLKC